jgi:type 1 fimbria pilin
MKKAFLSIGIVCLIVFLSVSFTAATCTVAPGPVVTYYTQFLNNNSGVPVYIEVDMDMIFGGLVRTSSIIYSGQQGSVAAENGYYIRVRNANTGQYLTFNPPNTGDATYYWINTSNTFTISGGGWVSPAR